MNVNTKTGVVVGMNGTYEGKSIALSPITAPAQGTINGFNYSYAPDDPSSVFNTLQDVPNTTGANYNYDDVYNPTANPGTGADVDGILVSTGAGASKTYYEISVDYTGASH